MLQQYGGSVMVERGSKYLLVYITSNYQLHLFDLEGNQIHGSSTFLDADGAGLSDLKQMFIGEQFVYLSYGSALCVHRLPNLQHKVATLAWGSNLCVFGDKIYLLKRNPWRIEVMERIQ
jgi:hypothetical protein